VVPSSNFGAFASSSPATSPPLHLLTLCIGAHCRDGAPAQAFLSRLAPQASVRPRGNDQTSTPAGRKRVGRAADPTTPRRSPMEIPVAVLRLPQNGGRQTALTVFETRGAAGGGGGGARRQAHRARLPSLALSGPPFALVFARGWLFQRAVRGVGRVLFRRGGRAEV
jgi:hypothetical protein